MNIGIYIFLGGFLIGSALIAAGVRIRPLEAIWGKLRMGAVTVIESARTKIRR